MLNWFYTKAPIRQKFDALTIVLTATAAAPAIFLIASRADVATVSVSALSVGLTLVVCLMAKKLICTPYVGTVVRMEALAAGDLDSAIDYTAHTDCVGRMTKAMEVFRDNAAAVQQASTVQRQVVTELASGLDALTNGDLTYRISVAFAPEYEALRNSFNQSLEGLGATLAKVVETAATVETGASEIRLASDDLASRTEQQTAKLSETVSAMNRVTEMTKDTARGASDVNRSIIEAHREASEGGVVVRRAVDAMGAIEKSAQQITQIINVIDGIAFQTNLLALNAGVEAARAGDAGRGFAVVASEVRALAQRSADAAKDIKALITTSAEQVGSGVSLVGETGTLLERIVERVGEISGLITTITDAAESQATSLQQVNSAVGDMDKMTQQNAAMVEESTAASRNLAEEAQTLNSVVGQFKIGNGAPVRQPAATPARSAPRRKARAPMVVGNLALQSGGSDDDWAEF